MRKPLTLAALAALVVGSTAHAEKPAEQIARQIRRAPAEVEQLIQVKGDALDPRIEVNTYGATQVVNKGLLGTSADEPSFLRGYIDRKTGQVSAQIYHIVNYSAQTWHFYNRGAVEMPGGLRETEAARIGSNVDCTGSRYGGCYFTEEVILPVQLDDLEDVARRFDPAAAPVVMRYRIFAQSGDTIDEAVPVNEVVAFVNVLHRAMAEAHITPSASSAAAPPGPLGFKAMPSPVGLVIMVVDPGSLAEKAGLKPGETIEKVNGLSMRNVGMADIQKILAAQTGAIVMSIVGVGDIKIARPAK